MSIESLLYLHKKTLSSREIKKDVDFLVNLLRQEGIKKRRWKIYLDEKDGDFEDGNIHSHCCLLEQLTYREVMIEGVDEEKALLLMWAARFHKLGELKNGDVLFNLKTQGGKEGAKYVRENIHAKLESDYAKDMLEKVIAIALEGRNMTEDAFDLVDFFDSLQCRGHINTALRMIEQKTISNWDILAANVFFNQIIPLVEHGKKYRSVRVFLQKNAKMITYGLENHLTHENLNKSFERIYGQENFQDKKKLPDISLKKIAEIKNVWLAFVAGN